MMLDGSACLPCQLPRRDAGDGDTAMARRCRSRLCI